MSQYSLEPANYSDYRDFIRSRMDALKKSNPKWSLQYFATKGQISKAHLQFLLKKERHLSLDKFPAIARVLKMTTDEEYFTYLLLCKNASQNEVVQDHFEKIMSRIRHQYVNAPLIETTPYDNAKKALFENHFKMILKTAVKIHGFKEDSKWIKEHLLIPNLSTEQIETTLKALEANGFLYREAETGILKAKDVALRPDPYDPNGFNVYTRAAEATAELMQTPHVYKPSVYSAMTLSMDEEHLLLAEKLIIDVHHQLCKLAKESVNPTALLYIGNFLLTLMRLKSNPTT